MIVFIHRHHPDFPMELQEGKKNSFLDFANTSNLFGERIIFLQGTLVDHMIAMATFDCNFGLGRELEFHVVTNRSNFVGVRE